MVKQVSEHISYNEATKLQAAIRLGLDNTPSLEHLAYMVETANNVFEPLRKHFAKPIAISTFYRSPEVNKQIPGASLISQHCLGQAIDLDGDVYKNPSNEEIFRYILDNLEYDQLIAEGAHSGAIQWVHVSFIKGKNRKQPLIMYKKKGSTKSAYLPYTPESMRKFIPTWA